MDGCACLRVCERVHACVRVRVRLCVRVSACLPASPKYLFRPSTTCVCAQWVCARTCHCLSVRVRVYVYVCAGAWECAPVCRSSREFVRVCAGERFCVSVRGNHLSHPFLDAAPDRLTISRHLRSRVRAWLTACRLSIRMCARAREYACVCARL